MAFAGFTAGLLGIGGALIFNPVLLQLGVHPQVLSLAAPFPPLPLRRQLLIQQLCSSTDQVQPRGFRQISLNLAGVCCALGLVREHCNRLLDGLKVIVKG